MGKQIARRKIIVLGGGVASLSAAWALTEIPGAQQRFDIEVHEASWRLGGKCASHRGVHGRIEEHGLHVLLGAYHNVFSMMRRVYEVLERPADHPLRTWDGHAVGGNGLMCLYERIGDELVPWKVQFPKLAGRPGDGDSYYPSARNWLRMAAGFVDRLRLDVQEAAQQGTGVGHELRRAATFLEIASKTVVGLIRDNVLQRGLDALDDEDLRQWLRRHGVSQRALDSAPVRSLYQIVFAEMDIRQPNAGLSAATGVRCMLQWILCYRGHLAYWMQGGTSEVLIAPMYEALAARGVTFRFFSRCEDLQLDATGQRVEAIRLAQDDRGKRYEPLVEVGGIACWREEPPRRKRGQRERKVTLQLGEDFDTIVLGIPVAALTVSCPSLLSALPRWQQMVDGLRTTRTLGLQVWSDEARQTPQEIANTGVDPLTGYSDMSHLLQREQWPTGDEPRHVMHVCHRVNDNELPEGADHDAWQRHGRDVALRWLQGRGGMHVPGARGGSGREKTDFSVFHAPVDSAEVDGADPDRRLEHQFTTVATSLSDRYALAVPGTLKYRIAPDDSGVENLALCGTWTRNGWHVGTVESAVVSGRLAARHVGKDAVPVIGEHDFP